jgi:lipoyl(octanoyl) transferase
VTSDKWQENVGCVERSSDAPVSLGASALRSTHPTASPHSFDSPPLSCRFFVHGPADGAWNMAVDEALLESAAADGVATLRFYEWSAPTLSLGYFQPAADRREHLASLACPFVRRASGGGAILHDRELTYSLAVPTTHRWAADPERLYLATHEAIASALEMLGIACQLRRGAVPGRAFQPFLCFQRRAIGDLLLGDVKIAGSAQRRHRGAVLQHGSVLLRASRFATELPGLAELTGLQIDAKALAHLLKTAFRDRLNLQWEQSADLEAILGSSESLARSKYTSAEWTLRR